MFTFRKPVELPTPESALPGRETPRPVAVRHLDLDKPIAPLFPGGFERIVVGMGCFWGEGTDRSSSQVQGTP